MEEAATIDILRNRGSCLFLKHLVILYCRKKLNRKDERYEQRGTSATYTGVSSLLSSPNSNTCVK